MLYSPRTSEFVRLWTLHGQSIYAYVLTLASNYDDADEIYQDIGMTLWEKFDHFTPGTNFHAWARRVAFNKVRSFRQLRRHNTVLCSPELLDAIDRTVTSSMETLDTQHEVFANCFDKLPARHKDLIERRYQPGATPSTLAAQMGRSVNTIYQALSRIHNTLFDCVRKATIGGELR